MAESAARDNDLLDPPEEVDFSTPQSDKFIKSITDLNPTHLLFLDDKGCPIESEDPLPQASMLAVICRNPEQYEGDEKLGILGKEVTVSAYKSIASTIRTGQKTLCSGQISRAFFSEMEKSADVFFLLYLLSVPARASDVNKRSLRLIGFVSCNDLSQSDLEEEEDTDKHEHVMQCDRPASDGGGDQTSENPGGKTLYIDAICAKLQLRGNETAVPNVNMDGTEVNNLGEVNTKGAIKISVGKVLLSLVEQYALLNDFKQLKLSALGYVINYYRKMGYLHNFGCGSSETEEIKAAGTKAAKTLFKSEDQANLVYYVEKALKFLDKSRSKSDQEVDFEKDLKKYLEDTSIDYEEKYDSIEELFNDLPTPKGGEKLTLDKVLSADVDKDYYGYYNLLRLLTKDKFSVACGEGKHSERQAARVRDEDGDPVDCTDEGFTMRKCLVGEDAKLISLGCAVKESGTTHFGGKKKKKRKTRKKSNKKKRASKKGKSTRKRKKK